MIRSNTATVPTLPYDRWVREHTEVIPQAQVVKQHDCPICLERYTAEQPIRIVGIPGCSHVIGAKCLVGILKQPATVEKKCPLCRTTWIAGSASPPAPSARPQTMRATTSRSRTPRATSRPTMPMEREASVTAESFAAFQRDIADIRARASTSQRPRHERRRSEIPRPVSTAVRRSTEPLRVQKDLPALPAIPPVLPPPYSPSPEIQLGDDNAQDREDRLNRREADLNCKERKLEDRERALKRKEGKIQEMRDRHVIEQQQLAKRQDDELTKLLNSVM